MGDKLVVKLDENDRLWLEDPARPDRPTYLGFLEGERFYTHRWVRLERGFTFAEVRALADFLDQLEGANAQRGDAMTEHRRSPEISLVLAIRQEATRALGQVCLAAALCSVSLCVVVLGWIVGRVSHVWDASVSIGSVFTLICAARFWVAIERVWKATETWKREKTEEDL